MVPFVPNHPQSLFGGTESHLTTFLLPDLLPLAVIWTCVPQGHATPLRTSEQGGTKATALPCWTACA